MERIPGLTLNEQNGFCPPAPLGEIAPGQYRVYYQGLRDVPQFLDELTIANQSGTQRELPFEKDVQFRDLCVWTLESEKNLRGLSEFYTRTNFG